MAERKRRSWRRTTADAVGGEVVVGGGCCLLNALSALAFVTAAGIIPLLMR